MAPLQDACMWKECPLFSRMDGVRDHEPTTRPHITVMKCGRKFAQIAFSLVAGQKNRAIDVHGPGSNMQQKNCYDIIIKYQPA